MTSGNVDIRNYSDVLIHLLKNTDFSRDIIFTRGPLDVLDHASDAPAFGGKAGIDATVKLPEEIKVNVPGSATHTPVDHRLLAELIEKDLIRSFNNSLAEKDIPLLILGVDTASNPDATAVLKKVLMERGAGENFRLILVVDYPVDINDYYTVAWQMLGNSDPLRDHEYLSPSSILIDGTVKAFRKGGFPRRWPNIVCSDSETIKNIDKKWHSLGIGDFVSSPSHETKRLIRKGTDEIIISLH